MNDTPWTNRTANAPISDPVDSVRLQATTTINALTAAIYGWITNANTGLDPSLTKFMRDEVELKAIELNKIAAATETAAMRLLKTGKIQDAGFSDALDGLFQANKEFSSNFPNNIIPDCARTEEIMEPANVLLDYASQVAKHFDGISVAVKIKNAELAAGQSRA